MIYIDPSDHPFFKTTAEVIQSNLKEPSEITTDYKKRGTWVLNWLSFKKNVVVNGPYIVVQTEQLDIQGSRKYRTWLSKAIKVWDWTSNFWFGYSSVYRLQAEKAKDIDVLFYGAMNERRLAILKEIEDRGHRVTVQSNRYGADLWPIIWRSKIILSIHYYDKPQNDMPRIAPLLSNGCFVMCESTVDQKFNSLTDLVIVKRADIAEKVTYFLEHPALRLVWADRGRKWIVENPHCNDLT
jgi:hypothetical protein